MYCNSKLTNIVVHDFIDQGEALGGDTRDYFETKLDESMSFNTTLLEPSDSDTDSGTEWL